MSTRFDSFQFGCKQKLKHGAVKDEEERNVKKIFINVPALSNSM